ncbi:MAG: ATP synthase F1 subunit gamma [Candidatus Marinamargulisbacteria bacterium]
MATNTREIKDRITSVEKTNKITQAMKMVSAAKFKRNLVALDHTKDYGEGLEEILDSLTKRLFDDELPALLTGNDSPQVAIIVISSDRGLCGGFNANLFKKVQQTLDEYPQVDLYTVGNKAQQFYKSKNVKVVESIQGFSLNSSHSEISDYINGFVDSYLKGVYSKVLVIYNEFVSALSSNQVVKQVLPISLDNWNRDEIDSSDFIYESSKQSALDHFLKLLISYNFSRAVHESLASEEGFRMAAMDSASSNAKEMIQELTLYYNRSRQAAITTELTEIVAGAASIS